MLELFRIGFLSVTVLDVLDVLLVATLFFMLYRALRNTIAVQVLLLFVVVFVLGFVTEAANLKTVNWVLRRIADVGLIAFVVLFQPELRRILLMITQSRLFRLVVRGDNTMTITAVLQAVSELSSKHVGALIVFSRAEHIRVTVDTGVSLQADVSAELLTSIFNPRSPLHDGAVVIDGGTISAARCVLPLSSEQRLGLRNLGTRHRAGLGITEQADAVAIIVSEETGGVSLAYQGALELDVPSADLRSKLEQYVTAVAAA